MNIPPKYEDVVANLDAALAEVERLKNMDHRQILAESAAKYLLDSGAENFIGDVFTIEADDGLVKFEVIVTTQKVGAKSPGEVCKDLQQRLTVAEQRNVALEAALKFYADGDHLLLADADAWDTCSGEPVNFLHDEAGTASVEDGSIAKAALKPAAGDHRD